MIAFVIQDHPDRTCANLRCEFVRCLTHYRPFLSGVRASGNPGAVHNRSGKRQCVVIMRERKGRSLPFVVANEGDAVPFVRDHVGTLATIHADEGTGWDALHAGWDTHRVNHSVQFMDKCCATNKVRILRQSG